MHKLFLVSGSGSRAALLEQAGIPFEVLSHTANECAVTFNGDFADYVLRIAQLKMSSIDTSRLVGTPGDTALFLTADSLAQTSQGNTILGKPSSRDDANFMLDLLRAQEARVASGCVLSLRLYKDNNWVEQDRREWTTTSRVTFQVPRCERDAYFAQCPSALKACGGAIIEGYGSRYLRTMTGSYSAVLGLPIPELLDAMRQLGCS